MSRKDYILGIDVELDNVHWHIFTLTIDNYDTDHRSYR